MKHTRFKKSLNVTLAISVFAGTIFTNSSAQAAPLSNTDAFLRSAFTNGQFIPGFTPGKPDFGFSLEALLQRHILGESNTSLQAATKYLLEDTANTGTVSSPTGYLFNGSKLRLGLAGKWAFVSSVLKAKNSALRQQIISAALGKIDGSGDVAADAGANTYDRAWLVLGLEANNRPRQAALLATNLANHQLSDGGFNDGFTLGTSSSDGTGISLQALSAGRVSANSQQRTIISRAIAKAVAYLSKTINEDHFDSYGDYDLNGTAYAAMGLDAAGASSSKIQSWLKSKLAADGGLQTPWSAGAGDIYATAQAPAAVLGESYSELLKGSGNTKSAGR